MTKKESFYVLNEFDIDPQRLKRERDRARKLKKSQWWLDQVNRGVCYYCEKKFAPGQLTLDHVVPLARGGKSQPGNVVPACKACNREKSLDTPVDRVLAIMAEIKKAGSSENE